VSKLVSDQPCPVGAIGPLAGESVSTADTIIPRDRKDLKDAYLKVFPDLAPAHSLGDLQRTPLEQLMYFLIEISRDFCYFGSL